ncbi:MAG: zinc-finger domain-containing protein [Rhodospirillales bacterium]|nr:zinc-finger domain-containing protein [Rhodospirillales bacterium]
MDVQETIFVDDPVVGCDGGGGALGHPLVYLKIDETREITCPYCSRHFVLTEGAGAATGH